MIRSSTDSDADGTADGLTTYSFDAFGNQTSRRRDFDADGVFESATTAAYSYDAEGRLVSESLDLNDDAIAEQTIRYSPYKIETEIGTEFGGGFSGNIIFRGTTDVIYDDQGRLSAEYIDIQDNGLAVRTVLYDYNETGRTVRRINDYDTGGVADQIYTTSYDLAGNVLRDTSDYQGDGIDDEINTFEYDDAGNLLVETSDRDEIGDIDTITYYTYDADGNRTSFSRDFTGDGIVDFAQVYTYDEFGNRLTEANRNVDTGVESVFQTNIYIGIPVVAPTPTTPEAQLVVLSEFYTYDAMGNLTITYDYDRDGDNVVDSKFSYTFDSSGSQIGEIRDYDADGTIDFANGRSLLAEAIAPQPLGII